jgi:uncharacterized membrane protein YfcA
MNTIMAGLLVQVPFPLVVGLLIHILSAVAAFVVSLAAYVALNRINKTTMRVIKTAYVLVFGGCAGAAVLSLCAIFIADDMINELMHLFILITLAGFSALFIGSRRRDCLCTDCPARKLPEPCGDCDLRGSD